jgi:hypothetical protein
MIISLQIDCFHCWFFFVPFCVLENIWKFSLLCCDILTIIHCLKFTSKFCVFRFKKCIFLNLHLHVSCNNYYIKNWKHCSNRLRSCFFWLSYLFTITFFFLQRIAKVDITWIKPFLQYIPYSLKTIIISSICQFCNQDVIKNIIKTASGQNQHGGFVTSMDPDQPAPPGSLIRIHAVRLPTL